MSVGTPTLWAVTLAAVLVYFWRDVGRMALGLAWRPDEIYSIEYL